MLSCDCLNVFCLIGGMQVRGICDWSCCVLCLSVMYVLKNEKEKYMYVLYFVVMIEYIFMIFQ